MGFNYIINREDRCIDVKEVELLNREEKDNNVSGRQTITVSLDKTINNSNNHNNPKTTAMTSASNTTNTPTTCIHGYELVIV